jgi:hypothetical protein
MGCRKDLLFKRPPEGYCVNAEGDKLINQLVRNGFMGGLAALLLGATVTLTAQYSGSSPPTKTLPAFTVEVQEYAPKHPCLGIGYDQKVTINLEDKSVARVVVEDFCANENKLGGKDIITVHKPGEFGEELYVLSDADAFIKDLYVEARWMAWQQNSRMYAQQIAERITGTVRDGQGTINDKTRGIKESIMGVFVMDDNGVKRNGKTQHSVWMSYVPKGDSIMLSFAQIDARHSSSKIDESALVLYVFDHAGKDTFATAYYDTDMNCEVNSVSVLPVDVGIDGRLFLDKAVKRQEAGAIPVRAPTAEERRFFREYLQGLALGRLVNEMALPSVFQRYIPTDNKKLP